MEEKCAEHGWLDGRRYAWFSAHWPFFGGWASIPFRRRTG